MRPAFAASRRVWLLPLAAMALAAALLAALYEPPPAAQAPPPTPTFPPWHLDPASPRPPDLPGPNVPHTVEDLRAAGGPGTSRCREGDRRWLYVLRGDALAWGLATEDVVGLPGSTTVAGAQGRPLPAVPLDALLSRWSDVATAEVWPCEGDPVSLAVAAVAAEPGRWLVVLTPRGILKLVDVEQDARQPLVRNVAALRLLP